MTGTERMARTLTHPVNAMPIDRRTYMRCDPRPDAGSGGLSDTALKTMTMPAFSRFIPNAEAVAF